MKHPSRLLALAALFLTPALALAQDAPATHRSMDPMTLLYGVGATFLYGMVGIAIAAIGTKVFQWVMPFSVKDELEKDHNLSVGVVMAAMVLGICLIVAATILS